MNKPMGVRERQQIEAILQQGGSEPASWLRRRDVRWAATIVVALLLGAAIWAFSGRSSAVRYVTQPAVRGGLIVSVTATGSVQQYPLTFRLRPTIERTDRTAPPGGGVPMAPEFGPPPIPFD